ncbi:MAG: SH3 domain-containing protein [Bacilli bacterium]
MKIFKSIVTLIVIAALGLIAYKGYIMYKEDKAAWKIEIINDSVKVRGLASVFSNEIGTVNKGDKYKVIDISLDDKRYVWYKIKLEKNKYGWIGSGRNEPYVKEINNPKRDEKEDYIVDYKKPIIKYEDEVYITKSLKTINYEHLIIEEDSPYDITSNVYYEAHPIDKLEPQFWIEYIVTDKSNNTNSIVQRIDFEELPKPSDVLDFKLLQEKRNK